MNKTEAVKVNTLLCWALGIDSPGGPVGDDLARGTAIDLAGRVNTTLGAGITPQRVANEWDDQRPVVVVGPAQIVRLGPARVRQYFADDCEDCPEGAPHDCRVQQLARVTDEQLHAAGDKVARHDNALDDAEVHVMEHVLDVALDMVGAVSLADAAAAV